MFIILGLEDILLFNVQQGHISQRKDRYDHQTTTFKNDKVLKGVRYYSSKINDTVGKIFVNLCHS